MPLLRKKAEFNYFEQLTNMVRCSLRAAQKLHDLMQDFTHITEKADAIHDIEHEGDGMLHDLVHALNTSFVTPIDREDLLSIGSGVDTITDLIEDVANLFDMLSIDTMQPEAKAMAQMIVRCCEALVVVTGEFHLFKQSKKLTGMVIDVNHLEEEGDRLHRRVIKQLYANKSMDTLDIIKWKELYDAMEEVLDACEDVADTLEGLAVKNG